MQLFDALLGQRAYRALRPDPVSDEVIEQILTAATHAPSAENTQPWLFVVVKDAAIRAQIGAMTRSMWEGGGREHARRHLAPRMFTEVDEWATGGLAQAPVHIVVCGDTSLVPAALLPSSIYPAVQNLLLAAIGLGLGSLLSTLPLVGGFDFATLLGLPDHVRALALVPIGYPERALTAGRRIDAADKTYRDRFDQPWVTPPEPDRPGSS